MYGYGLLSMRREAWFTANLMQSSGNYKKNVDALKIKERDAKAEKAKVT